MEDELWVTTATMKTIDNGFMNKSHLVLEAHIPSVPLQKKKEADCLVAKLFVS